MDDVKRGLTTLYSKFNMGFFQNIYFFQVNMSSTKIDMLIFTYLCHNVLSQFHQDKSILDILGRKKFNENLVLYKTVERAKAREGYH